MHLSSYIVTPAQLDKALSTGQGRGTRLIPLSAAWFLPNDPEKRTGSQSFRDRRIPGSRFFDLDEVKDHASPWPHMLPDSKGFAEAMGKLGIRRDDTVVVYDTAELGIFSAPRVAWTLKVFGHPRTHLLNNFRLWVEERRPTESGEPQKPEQVTYDMPTTVATSSYVADFHEMQSIVRAKRDGAPGAASPLLLDARPKGRWEGEAPEPRPGLPSGHMPGSNSLCFTDVLDPQTKTLLPPQKLRELFETRQLPSDKEIISSCGTGVTAAVLDTALAEAGWSSSNARRIYDGSWTEWASKVRAEDGWIQPLK